MGNRVEYLTKEWYTVDEILKLQDFNYEVKRALKNGSSVNALASAFSGLTSIISIVGLGTVSTIAGLASVVVAGIASLSTVEKNVIIDTLENGESDLYDIRQVMQNTTATKVYADIGWLEFQDVKVDLDGGGDKKFRTVQGAFGDYYEHEGDLHTQKKVSSETTKQFD